MFVTRHNSVGERGLVERLWGLYELAYRKTAEESASREMFFRSEFDAAIADSTNRLWVLWADDEPVAMVLIATDMLRPGTSANRSSNGISPITLAAERCTTSCSWSYIHVTRPKVR
jgi:hypothetical protein